ncbi:PIG-L domain-containing protein [Amycolatopsis balhimycina DSM 5908]|uniref:PIG-L domain-containing protein n=1 Tax=Amycolatopsis balhimycina DSM 5908 TaxID=1081091 RepID=A0A428WTP8_AMYBA|nr:PIG-L family deacetylase [Amycolatopsis balhimycina]RSM46461.1 PIG-L domain-containing protein [Amycolatopsis balhimycina DSM 5908]
MSTLVAFHAHADDPVLLSGGTLARATADGHRVVIVVATDGMGAECPTPRWDELRAAAAILGAHRVVHLGYAESGHGPVLYPDPPGRRRFVRADTGEAAERLAALLREERADVLLGYDPNGGYGHPDHVKVHEVARRAAALTGTRLLEATMPRDVVVRLTRLVRALRIPFRYDTDALSRAYSPASAITHRFDVRRFAARKQAALAAHVSDVRGTGRLAPVLRVLVWLPAPVFALVAGREWYVDVTRR